ncbi:MAG: DUF6655 family protein [Pirellulaceae bacterium]
MFIQRNFTILFTAFALLATFGCGTTQTRTATEQLVVSDAVDKAIANIDFRPLTGQKVYLDTNYLRPVKTDTFINSEYVVSGLRQQLIASRCLIQDRPEDADIIIEARVGTMATNRHEVIYGIPQSNTLNTAASVVSSQPLLPAIPELSLAKSDATVGISKVAVYAYDRMTREPVWQSGTSRSESNSKSSWVLGAGPFQKGSIYRGGYRFAGEDWKFEKSFDQSNPPIDFAAEHLFSNNIRTANSNTAPAPESDNPAKRVP